MTKLGAAIAETVVRDYGASAFLSRLNCWLRLKRLRKLAQIA
jgi:hypothetical protein